MLNNYLKPDDLHFIFLIIIGNITISVKSLFESMNPTSGLTFPTNTLFIISAFGIVITLKWGYDLFFNVVVIIYRSAIFLLHQLYVAMIRHGQPFFQTSPSVQRSM